jgi:hypothetical protein
MAYVNMTNLTSANDFLSITRELNTATGSFLGSGIIFSLMLVLVIAFIHRGFKEALLGSSSITSIVAVLLWGIQIISMSTLLIPIILMFVSLVSFLFTK